MSVDSPALWLALIQIIWINILLSGDNAVVIAMACRSLPEKTRKWGIITGAGVAVALRILFTGICGDPARAALAEAHRLPGAHVHRCGPRSPQ